MRRNLYRLPIKGRHGVADQGRPEPEKPGRMYETHKKERAENMVVFGRTKREQAGNILFTGNPEQCQEYAAALNPLDFDMLSICDNGGTIKEKIVEYGLPVPAHMKNT